MPNQLSDALKNNDSSDRVKELIHLYPTAIKAQDIYGRLPLHIALKHYVCKDDVINMLVQAYPEATKVQDNDGWLPLHFALRYDASSDVINMLVKAYPKATEVQNKNGCLPLHYALLFRTPDVIKMIFETYPKAAEVKNNINGFLPLHAALDNKASNDVIKMIFKAYPEAAEIKNDFGSLPLHQALCYNASDDVVNMLVQAYPEATGVQDNDGCLPLHFALRYNASLDIINMLVKAYPKAAEVQDNDGWLPLHVALIEKASPSIINMLFNTYPKATEKQTNGGNLPLHLACDNNASDDVIMTIFKAYPEAIEIQNKNGKTPLNYAHSRGISCYLFKLPYGKEKKARTERYVQKEVQEEQMPSMMSSQTFQYQPSGTPPKNINDTSELYNLQQWLFDDKQKELELLCDPEPSILPPGSYNDKIIRSTMTSGKIQPVLQQLIGVYDDPLRICQDTTQLLNQVEGSTLSPRVSSFMEHPQLLSLAGTIPIIYHGVEYSIPVEFFLPPSYPLYPPICYVRPSADMILKENHRHVGLDGRISIPYLVNWKNYFCNLEGLVLTLSSIFSEEPPCYAKPVVPVVPDTTGVIWEEPIDIPLHISPRKDAYLLSEQHSPLNGKLKELGICETEPSALPPNSYQDTSAELLDLCKRAYQRKDYGSYNNIQKWLGRNEKKQNLLIEAANYKNSFSRTPLHYLAGANPPSSLAEKILKLSTATLMSPDAHGKLPLHWACCNDASLDVVRNLLNVYPEAAKVQDDDGCTPLHHVCRHHASSNVVGMILEECPEASRKQNNEGDLPLHIACKGIASPEVLNLLIDRFPESITEKNKDGMLPEDLVHDSDIKNVFCAATLSEPKKNDVGHENKIYIDNKTGRCIKVEYYKALRTYYLAGVSAKVISFEFARTPHDKTNIERPGLRYIEPNQKKCFEVPQRCKGLYFDFFCYKNDSYVWELNHYVKKGYTQEISGQPYKLMGC